MAETAILLVSELVTNAVVHTGRPAVLRLLLAAARDGSVSTVRLEVADTSTCPPARRCAEGDETGGRGLALVEGLADRWGWSPEGVGKRIWCELDRCVPGMSGVGAVAAPAMYPMGAGVPTGVGIAAVAREGLAFGAV